MKRRVFVIVSGAHSPRFQRSIDCDGIRPRRTDNSGLRCTNVCPTMDDKTLEMRNAMSLTQIPVKERRDTVSIGATVFSGGG